MIRTLTAGVLLFIAAAPSHPQEGRDVSSRSYPVLADLRWQYEPGGGDRTSALQLRIVRDGHTITFDESEARGLMGEGATASLTSPGEAVAFALVRPAGALSCSGRVESRQRAAGTCRFDPDERFAAALAARRLTPADSAEMLSLALVDARLELIDALSRAGFTIDDVDTVIAIAALEVTPAYAAELRGAGLAISTTDDLITAQAVGLDADWLRGMAQAGVGELSTEQAIELRALDVTPDYARKMARVNAALEEGETR